MSFRSTKACNFLFKTYRPKLCWSKWAQLSEVFHQPQWLGRACGKWETKAKGRGSHVLGECPDHLPVSLSHIGALSTNLSSKPSFFIPFLNESKIVRLLFSFTKKWNYFLESSTKQALHVICIRSKFFYQTIFAIPSDPWKGSGC